MAHAKIKHAYSTENALCYGVWLVLVIASFAAFYLTDYLAP